MVTDAGADGDEEAEAGRYGEEDDDEDGGETEVGGGAAVILGVAQGVLVGVIVEVGVAALAGAVGRRELGYCSIGRGLVADYAGGGLAVGAAGGGRAGGDHKTILGVGMF
jgi:hypothetical protein